MLNQAPLSALFTTTCQRQVRSWILYSHFDLRFTISILLGHALRQVCRRLIVHSKRASERSGRKVRSTPATATPLLDGRRALLPVQPTRFLPPLRSPEPRPPGSQCFRRKGYVLSSRHQNGAEGRGRGLSLIHI